MFALYMQHMESADHANLSKLVAAEGFGSYKISTKVQLERLLSCEPEALHAYKLPYTSAELHNQFTCSVHLCTSYS